MNDEQIIEALRDSELSARPLDPRRVIASARQRRQRKWAGVAAVTAVAGTVAAVGVVGLGRGGVDTEPTPAATPAGPSPIRVTLGRLDAAEQTRFVEKCVEDRYGPKTPGGVVHPVRVRDMDGGSSDAMVVRDSKSGLAYGCIHFFGLSELIQRYSIGTGSVGSPSVAEPTVDDPVVDTRAGQQGFGQESADALSHFQLDRWYRVDARVGQLRQRYVTAGEPGPWFVADAVDGYVFTRSWLVRSLGLGESSTIQTEALGRDGQPIADSDLRDRVLRMSPDGTPQLSGD